MLVFNLGSLLGNHDGLHFVLGAGLVDPYFTFTDFAGGVVFQGEGHGVVVGLYVGHGDPAYLGLDGLLVQGNVGNDVCFHSAVLGIADIVDGLGIRLIGGLGVGLLFLGAEGEFHDGGETYLGVGVGEGGTLGHYLGRDHEFVGLNLGFEVGVREDVHLGARGLGVHGVGNVKGLGGGHLVLRLGNDQLEGRADGDVHLAVIGEGEHHILVGNLDVGEDTVLQGSATAEAAEFGLGAGDDSVQLAVLYIDVGHLAYGQFLAVVGEGRSVDSPVKDIAFLDDTQYAGTAAGRDLQGNNGAVTVSDSNALGGLFHLLDVLAQGNSLNGLDLGLQVAYLGLERGDPVLELGVIVLFGAAHEEQSRCKSK